METKQNAATAARPDGDRFIDAPLVATDLRLCARQLREEEVWHKNDRNAITLFKSENISIVLIAMHRHAELMSHIAERLLCIQVLEGAIRFDAEARSMALSEGQMVMLHEGNSYNVTATTEAVFLLTMEGPEQTAL